MNKNSVLNARRSLRTLALGSMALASLSACTQQKVLEQFYIAAVENP